MTNRRIFWALLCYVRDVPSDDAEAHDWCIDHQLIAKGSSANDGWVGDTLTLQGSQLFHETIAYFGARLKAYHDGGRLRKADQDNGKQENGNNTKQQTKRGRKGEAKQAE